MTADTLKPHLEPNRKEWELLGRRQWQVFGIALVSAVPLAIIVPPSYHQAALIVLLASSFAAFSYLEIRRVLIFRRDIRERKKLGLPIGPVDHSGP